MSKLKNKFNLNSNKKIEIKMFYKTLLIILPSIIVFTLTFIYGINTMLKLLFTIIMIGYFYAYLYKIGLPN